MDNILHLDIQRIIFAFMITLLAIGALAILLNWLNKNSLFKNRRLVQVLDKISLGGKNSLYVVQIDKRKLVLGISPTQIQKIYVLKEETVHE